MLRSIFALGVTALSLVVLVPLVAVIMLVTWNTSTSIWWARRVWSPMLLWAAGIKLRVEGQEHVDASRPAIYVANHQSAADIPVLFIAIPVNVRYVAKEQLRWVPLLGWYMWIAKFVFIDRSNRAKAIASLDRAGKRIRQGTSIIIYPEGTRSRDGRILPFKKGPFALALKARVPIVPVTIEGSGDVMPKNSWRVQPTVVKVKIGAPIDVSEYRDDERERLAHDVREVIVRQSLELGGKGGVPDDSARAPAGDAPEDRLRRAAS